MSINERLRRQVLDELKSHPSKTMILSEGSYSNNPGLQATLVAMELNGEIRIVKRSSRTAARPPLIRELARDDV